MIVAVIVLLFGMGLTLAPEFMGEQYLINPYWINDAAKFLAQGWGTLLIVNAVAYWYVRNEGFSSVGKVMLLFLLLSNLVLIVIHTMAVLNGVEKAIGWIQILLSVILRSGLLFRQANRVVA